jgi:predicted PurR-regulated permease PerM
LQLSVSLPEVSRGENLTSDQSSQKRLGTVLFYGIVIAIAYLVYLVFQPFLVALGWAAVLVVVFYPAYAKLARWWKPTAAAVAATAGVTIILIVPILFAMGAFVREGMEAGRTIQVQIATGHFAWVNGLWTRVQQRFPEANIPDSLTALHRYADQMAAYLASELGAVLRNTGVFLFHLGVTILAMFYLFRDGASIVDRFRVLLPFEEAHRGRMLSQTKDLIFASVTSSLAGAAAQGILGGLAFAVTGIHSPVFWGVMMGFFSLVPVVGSSLIWVPAAISLAVEGHIGRGGVLLLLCLVIVATVDNVVRPWLVSGRAHMGGLVVFISVLGGISVFGMLGIVLGPIVVATAASLLDLYVPRTPFGNSASEANGRKAGTVVE